MPFAEANTERRSIPTSPVGRRTGTSLIHEVNVDEGIPVGTPIGTSLIHDSNVNEPTENVDQAIGEVGKATEDITECTTNKELAKLPEYVPMKEVVEDVDEVEEAMDDINESTTDKEYAKDPEYAFTKHCIPTIMQSLRTRSQSAKNKNDKSVADTKPNVKEVHDISKTRKTTNVSPLKGKMDGNLKTKRKRTKKNIERDNQLENCKSYTTYCTTTQTNFACSKKYSPLSLHSDPYRGMVKIVCRSLEYCQGIQLHSSRSSSCNNRRRWKSRKEIWFSGRQRYDLPLS